MVAEKEIDARIPAAPLVIPRSFSMHFGQDQTGFHGHAMFHDAEQTAWIPCYLFYIPRGSVYTHTHTHTHTLAY